MDSNAIIGLVVGAIAAIVSLFLAIGVPIINLNKTITKLDSSVSHLTEQLDKDEVRIREIEDLIQKHATYLSIDKKRLDNHEERLSNLDGIVGLVDDEKRK